MSTISSPLTTNTATTPATTASASVTANQTTSKNFMTMLIAQMKYQDPTKPMDSAQMTSQLAQLSTVDGINQLNTTMSSLISNTQSSSAYQAANLIGRSVVVSSNQLTLGNGQAPFGVQLPSAADSVKVTITNPAGQVVRTLNLGAQAAGSVAGNWDGKDMNGSNVPSGNYSFQVDATVGAQAITATGTNTATVSSITQNGGNVMLNLSNQMSANASSLLQIN